MLDRVVLLGADVPSGRAVAKKLRSEQFSCTLLPSDAKAEDVARMDARGIILAGETAEGAQPTDPALLSMGLPVLAIGSPARALLKAIGHQSEGEIEKTVLSVYYKESALFRGIEASERWVEKAGYFDVQPPYAVIADGDGVPLGFSDEEKHIYLLQFQIERNDLDGTAMLRTFAQDICGCTTWWTPDNIIRDAEDQIRQGVGEHHAICAMSGGLDSTVAALLARRALGDRVRCVFVDTGLLREGEASGTEHYFRQELGLNFTRVDASERILWALQGLTAKDAKWRVIEREITDALLHNSGNEGPHVFIKGTNYADILAREDYDGPEGRIITPLSELFKDEIRQLGDRLGISDAVLNRQPFPGMGLAARIYGEVTAERLNSLRRADKIFTDEIIASGQEKRLGRYFALYSESEGVCVITLRALTGMEPSMSVARLPYDLLERAVERIRDTLPCAGRVLYDMTPGMAEW